MNIYIINKNILNQMVKHFTLVLLKKEDVERARDVASIKYCGEYAKLNFPISSKMKPLTTKT